MLPFIVLQMMLKAYQSSSYWTPWQALKSGIILWWFTTAVIVDIIAWIGKELEGIHSGMFLPSLDISFYLFFVIILGNVSNVSLIMTLTWYCRWLRLPYFLIIFVWCWWLEDTRKLSELYCADLCIHMSSCFLIVLFHYEYHCSRLPEKTRLRNFKLCSHDSWLTDVHSLTWHRVTRSNWPALMYFIGYLEYFSFLLSSENIISVSVHYRSWHRSVASQLSAASERH